MAYSEKYPITDVDGSLKILCYEHKYSPDANDGQGGYEDVVAIKYPIEFRSI